MRHSAAHLHIVQSQTHQPLKTATAGKASPSAAYPLPDARAFEDYHIDSVIVARSRRSDRLAPNHAGSATRQPVRHRLPATCRQRDRMPGPGATTSTPLATPDPPRSTGRRSAPTPTRKLHGGTERTVARRALAAVKRQNAQGARRRIVEVRCRPQRRPVLNVRLGDHSR
jgi:hypothetical protein